MGIKAVFGYGINVDRMLLIGRHNDIEMGHPKKFFDEKRFPALEVRVSSFTPFVGEHYVLLLKSTIVENARDAVQFDDPKDTAGLPRRSGTACKMGRDDGRSPYGTQHDHVS